MKASSPSLSSCWSGSSARGACWAARDHRKERIGPKPVINEREISKRASGMQLRSFSSYKAHLAEKRFLPPFALITSDEIIAKVQISHEGIQDFFTSTNLWIETFTHMHTIFEYDQNRRLHFDEGFLCACYRIYKDMNISTIASADHFPYKDLFSFRKKIMEISEIYRSKNSLPPPLFFYPAPYHLEILDGVHRCVAAFELAQISRATENQFIPKSFKILVGFNHGLDAEKVIQQLWTRSICHY